MGDGRWEKMEPTYHMPLFIFLLASLAALREKGSRCHESDDLESDLEPFGAKDASVACGFAKADSEG